MNEKLLEEKVTDDHATPLYPQKLALNFTDKWLSLCRYSSLAD
jgi:hypothetical protein